MLRLLTLLDEYTRECLAIRVERRLGSPEVIETLSDVMLWRGISEHFRSNNGPGVAAVAGEARDGNVIHRTRQSVGERILREFQ